MSYLNTISLPAPLSRGILQFLHPSPAILPVPTPLILANIHTLALKVLPRLHYLCLQFRVRLGNIVESEDAQAKLEEEVCAEGDESPEWELQCD
jgi:hypothetical protein